jgi:hypothetical protein
VRDADLPVADGDWLAIHRPSRGMVGLDGQNQVRDRLREETHFSRAHR